MDRQHGQTGVQQPLDEQTVRALDRDPDDTECHQRLAQPGDPSLIVRDGLAPQPLTLPVGDEHLVNDVVFTLGASIFFPFGG